MRRLILNRAYATDKVQRRGSKTLLAWLAWFVLLAVFVVSHAKATKASLGREGGRNDAETAANSRQLT